MQTPENENRTVEVNLGRGHGKHILMASTKQSATSSPNDFDPLREALQRLKDRVKCENPAMASTQAAKRIAWALELDECCRAQDPPIILKISSSFAKILDEERTHAASAKVHCLVERGINHLNITLKQKAIITLEDGSALTLIALWKSTTHAASLQNNNLVPFARSLPQESVRCRSGIEKQLASFSRERGGVDFPLAQWPKTYPDDIDQRAEMLSAIKRELKNAIQHRHEESPKFKNFRKNIADFNRHVDERYRESRERMRTEYEHTFAAEVDAEWKPLERQIGEMLPLFEARAAMNKSLSWDVPPSNTWGAHLDIRFDSPLPKDLLRRAAAIDKTLIAIEKATALPIVTLMTRGRSATHIPKLFPPRRDRNYNHRDFAV
ncbi:MAG TPA: hypothetical protein VGZ00_05180 [Candidatus Baltobacteraceae bacterium]|jgi:hypothetical protein|nr:hypothetical protein [Candidatus Baltobacteraceae bacterium]